MASCMCVQSTIVEGTGIMQIQTKSGLLPEIIFHGNRTNRVRCCAKFDAHTHYHCQVIKNNRYYLGLLIFAMATIVVDST